MTFFGKLLSDDRIRKRRKSVDYIEITTKSKLLQKGGIMSVAAIAFFAWTGLLIFWIVTYLVGNMAIWCWDRVCWWRADRLEMKLRGSSPRDPSPKEWQIWRDSRNEEYSHVNRLNTWRWQWRYDSFMWYSCKREFKLPKWVNLGIGGTIVVLIATWMIAFASWNGGVAFILIVLAIVGEL